MLERMISNKQRGESFQQLVVTVQRLFTISNTSCDRCVQTTTTVPSCRTPRPRSDGNSAGTSAIVVGSQNVTDYWHYTETQDHRLEGPETGSTPSPYVSDMVKDWVIDFGVRGLLSCIYFT